MTRSFERFAGACALAAAAAGIAFSIAFSVVVQEGERWAEWTSWAALLVGGLVTVPVVIGLFGRLRGDDPEFALLGLVLGATGALGAATHAAYELGVLAHPEYGSSGINPVDPRGFMTFAVTGLGLLVFGWLLRGSDALPGPVAGIALTAAVLLVVVYVGRLTALDPKSNVIRVAGLLSGLVVVPAFYVLLGREWLRGGDDEPVTP
jgi:hypothetical protein